MKRKRISLVALAALYGLLFQALIPLAQIIPLTNNGENFAGRLVICSAFGTKTIDVATGAEVPGGEDAPDDSTECVICLANAIGLNALSNACAIEYLQISSQSVAFPLSPLNVFHLRHLTDAHRARAPPTA